MYIEYLTQWVGLDYIDYLIMATVLLGLMRLITKLLRRG